MAFRLRHLCWWRLHQKTGRFIYTDSEGFIRTYSWFCVILGTKKSTENLVWSRHSMRHTGHTDQIYGRICRLHWVVKYVFTCSAKSLLLKTLFHQIFLKKRFSPRRICSMLLWDRTTPYWCCGIQTASYWKEVESPLAWNSCGSTPSTEVSCGIWNHRYRRLFEKF